jgi:hypothetical protein
LGILLSFSGLQPKAYARLAGDLLDMSVLLSTSPLPRQP